MASQEETMMPKVKKINPVEYVTHQLKIKKELMQQVDVYKAITGAGTRNVVINEIIDHYFSSSGGISPAMQNVLLKTVPPLPSPENAETLLALLMSDASDEDVARAFLEAMKTPLAQQIATMRSGLRQLEAEGKPIE
jgi:hypothetical protein